MSNKEYTILDIEPKDSKGKKHGYQQWYDSNNRLWLLGNAKHGEWIGYHVYNLVGKIGCKGTKINFHIR